MHKYQSHL